MHNVFLLFWKEIFNINKKIENIAIIYLNIVKMRLNTEHLQS